MTESPPVPSARPLSPHLQVWRWHLTMFCSIANRATGIALYVGALVLAAWAVCLALGPGSYGAFQGLMASLLGRLVLFGLTVSLFYHLAAGVRHLVWDAGYGYAPKVANLTAALSLAFAAVASVLVWVAAYLTGAL